MKEEKIDQSATRGVKRKRYEPPEEVNFASQCVLPRLMPAIGLSDYVGNECEGWRETGMLYLLSSSISDNLRCSIFIAPRNEGGA